MTNWLERAQRENQKLPGQPAAVAAERLLTAAMAAPHPGKSGISQASNGSNGSTPAAGSLYIEGGILAPPDLSGVSPDFAARLSPEDLEDIAAGDIPLATVQALDAAAMAAETEDLKEAFNERAGILEYDAGLPRPDAGLEAARITTTLARNRGYQWTSLRSALADYPELLAQVPQDTGIVDDALPLGVATLAVLKGRRVVRQGTFTGPHEVKP